MAKYEYQEAARVIHWLIMAGKFDGVRQVDVKPNPTPADTPKEKS